MQYLSVAYVCCVDASKTEAGPTPGQSGKGNMQCSSKKEAFGLPSDFSNSKDILTIFGADVCKTVLNLILKNDLPYILF